MISVVEVAHTNGSKNSHLMRVRRERVLPDPKTLLS